ncbi:MAG: hypothetical protein WCQ50_08020 [Spirochaetota bacterium]
MITIVYRLIVVLAAVLVISELLTQKSPKLKINAAIILVPLALRALMIA